MENNNQYIRKCDECKNLIHTSTNLYTMTRCMICDAIIEFRWKNIFKRIKSIF